MEYRAAMLEKRLSASTVNVRFSAIRKLIGEAQRNGIIGTEEAVPNLSQKGTRLGNWLTRDQAREFLTVPNRVFQGSDAHTWRMNKAQESDYAYHADRLLLLIAQKAKLEQTQTFLGGALLYRWHSRLNSRLLSSG
jgi:hypothetical protein